MSVSKDLPKNISEYPIEFQNLSKAVNELMNKHPEASVFFFVTSSTKAISPTENQLRSLSGGGFCSPRHAAMMAQAAANMIESTGEFWHEPVVTALGRLITKTVTVLYGAQVTSEANVSTSVDKSS